MRNEFLIIRRNNVINVYNIVYKPVNDDDDDVVEIANVEEYTGCEKPCCVYIPWLWGDGYAGKPYLEGLTRSTSQLYIITPPVDLLPEYYYNTMLNIIQTCKSAAEKGLCKLIPLQLTPQIKQIIKENHINEQVESGEDEIEPNRRKKRNCCLIL